jgi:hypothetical protein
LLSYKTGYYPQLIPKQKLVTRLSSQDTKAGGKKGSEEPSQKPRLQAGGKKGSDLPKPRLQKLNLN